MTTRIPRLVLASGSPARRRLLGDAGLAPVADVSRVDETIDAAIGTASAVCTLAERKASAVAGRHPGDLVLGCDSLLDLDGTPLGKPASPQAAVALWRDWLAEVATAAWGLPVVSLSGVHDVPRLPGLVEEQEPGGTRLGMLTYRLQAGRGAATAGLEVVTLNSLAEGRGIGTALLAGARQRARQAGQRLWLTTGNDNVQAIGFYQRRGMDIVALHRDFASEVRKIKPWLPKEPGGGIAFQHAIELEYPAPGGQ
jgi:ribosomal protein S18 acetylase RimI-like enzyme